ncbi:MAG: hypothetical protein ACI8QD_000651 [Cyclobacteriaceae bacterium]|jgi:hypothetical protein
MKKLYDHHLSSTIKNISAAPTTAKEIISMPDRFKIRFLRNKKVIISIPDIIVAVAD